MTVRRIEDVYDHMRYLPHKICDALCANCFQPRGKHMAGRTWAECKDKPYDPALDDPWCPEGDGFSTMKQFRTGPEVLT